MIYLEFDEIISEFINNENYKELQRYVAHGKTTIFSHCINVAYLCYKYAINHQKKEYDIKSLVRGAMMHDMYFYDWHKKNHKRPHGFFHSKIAYNNARIPSLLPREFEFVIQNLALHKSYLHDVTLETLC